MASNQGQSDSQESQFAGFTSTDVENIRKTIRNTVECSSDSEKALDSEDSYSEISSEDEDEDTAMGTIGAGDAAPGTNWKKDLTSPEVEPFSEYVGPNFQFSPDLKELDFFHMIFPESLLKVMADQTNLKAAQSPPDKIWSDTDISEMKVFLAINILMAILDLPSYKMYWSTDWLTTTSVPRLMARSRFEKLCQYFHVNDNSQNLDRNHPEYDKLFKVRPIYNKVLNQCQMIYSPAEYQAIDEAMVAFRGRLSFKQYLPLKPTKFGIKIWVRADSVTGFTHEFQVYTGRKRNAKGKAVTEKGLSSRVVQDLTAGLWGKKHKIVMDNYFASVDLFQTMLKHGLYCTGTVRTNRLGWPAELKGKVVTKQGDFVQCQDGNFTATSWHDKRQVNFLSTHCDPTQKVKIGRRKKDGTATEVEAPEVVEIYGKYMSGVDHADQLRSEYSVSRKSTKWWKYIFWYLVDTSIVNAFLLQKESPCHKMATKNGKPKEHTILNFRLALVHQLIGDSVLKQPKRRKLMTPTEHQEHWPVKMVKSRCVYCRDYGKVRHESRVGCSVCKVNLCIDCFSKYHK